MKVSQRMAKFFVDLWKMESCFLQIRVKVMKVLTTEISSGISDQNLSYEYPCYYTPVENFMKYLISMMHPRLTGNVGGSKLLDTKTLMKIATSQV